MILAALEAIAAGLVIGIPTDTVYGVAVDPINPEAVARLFELKGRPATKPVGLLAASLEQAEQIAEISDKAAELARQHWPGGLTIIVTPKVVMADWVGDTQRRTIGVRVPDHAVAVELLERSGPLAVTSANLSGGPEAMDDDEARSVFGDDVAVFVPGVAPGGKPSTVVDATGDRLVVLREGPVRI
ncbi:MAG TPA: L-threonylcarbamoyladenylate synthase [Acidimicrobiia bacterium]|nr:L-threonylcarbamoyladenylate synthase [Acidimicrobiia bacterium]